MKTGNATKVKLETSCVFTKRQVRRTKCIAILHVDAEPESTGEEIFELEGIHYGLHRSEGSVVELV